MSELPVSAETYFSDFEFDAIEATIIRDGLEIVTAKGLTNKEKGETYISFMYGTDIVVGDILILANETYMVYQTRIDTYNGEKQLINAFYR